MEEKGNPEKRNAFLTTGLQSLSLFLITYYVVVFLTGLSELYIAYDFDIPATLYLNGTIFHIAENDHHWTRDALTSVLLATPVSSFVLSMSAVFVFIVRKQKTQFMLYTSIWLLLQSFNMTFGLISENLITQTGLTKVAELQGLGKSALIVIVGLALYFMFQFGAFTSRLLFAHGGSTFRRHRYLSVISFFILPWLVGNAIVILVSGPELSLKSLVVKLMMLVMLAPAFFVRMPGEEATRVSPAWHTPVLILLSIAIVWISARVLGQGISF